MSPPLALCFAAVAAVVLCFFLSQAACHMVTSAVAWLPKENCENLARFQKPSALEKQQPAPRCLSPSTSPLRLAPSV